MRTTTATSNGGAKIAHFRSFIQAVLRSIVRSCYLSFPQRNNLKDAIGAVQIEVASMVTLVIDARAVRMASNITIATAGVRRRRAVLAVELRGARPHRLQLIGLCMFEMEEKVSGQGDNAYRPGSQAQRWNPKQDYS